MIVGWAPIGSPSRAVLSPGLGSLAGAEAAQIITSRLGPGSGFADWKQLSFVVVGVFDFLSTVRQVSEDTHAVLYTFVVNVGLLNGLLDKVQHTIHEALAFAEFSSAIVASGGDISEKLRRQTNWIQQAVKLGTLKF